MAGITLAQAQAQLDAYLAAETAVLGGQEYQINGRRLTRADLRSIQRHTVTIDNGTPIQGVSTLQPRPAQALAALTVHKPTLDRQLTLL